MVKKNEKNVLADHRIKLRKLVDFVNVSIERIQDIKRNVGMKKLSAKWVQRLLTEDQNRNRLITSE